MPDETCKAPRTSATMVSRRGFLTSVGAGTLATTIVHAGEGPAVAVVPSGEATPIVLLVNGRRHELRVEPRATLLETIRETLGLTGAKPGCERGECGACTVLVDGVARYSCLTLALEAQDRVITTVEGLMDGEQLGAVQQAFVQEDAFQCGFCTPGQVMAASALLRRDPAPDIDAIRTAMSGNLCRCGAYAHIFRAVQHASVLRRKEVHR
jgi:xanthine dehydrogenase YagT iron-sulfur-binding subunit